MAGEWIGTAPEALEALKSGIIPLSQADKLRDALGPYMKFIHFDTDGSENSAGAATTHDIPGDVCDRHRDVVGVAHRLLVTCDGAATLTVTEGTVVEGSGTAKVLLSTTAAGAFTVRVTDADDEEVHVQFHLFAVDTSNTPPKDGQKVIDYTADKLVTFIP